MARGKREEHNPRRKVDPFTFAGMGLVDQILGGRTAQENFEADDNEGIERPDKDND